MGGAARPWHLPARALSTPQPTGAVLIPLLAYFSAALIAATLLPMQSVAALVRQIWPLVAAGQLAADCGRSADPYGRGDAHAAAGVYVAGDLWPRAADTRP
jgi:hypothetical protein